MKLRSVLLVLVASSLFGCSSGGVIPGGPHSLSQLQLDTLVRNSAQEYHVAPGLIAAVIDVESHGDPSAVSRAGAQGLMQLMPGTSQQYGVFNPFDAQANVDAGTRYLHDLLRRYNGNVRLALAAYNAGPAAVDAAHGIPAFAETQAYVARVTSAYH